LKRYPSPADARSLGEARLQAFLAREHYTGRQKPAELLAKLRGAPEGRAGEVEGQARRQLVLCLVQTLTTLAGQINTLERQIAAAVRAHPDGAIFLSLFKGRNMFLTAAEMLAEIGDCRARYPNREALAADAGQAAVAIESGKPRRRRFAEAATSASAARLARSRTAPATGIPGPPTGTPLLVVPVKITRPRFVPSAAPGAGSSGSENGRPCTTEGRWRRPNARNGRSAHTTDAAPHWPHTR
jgi:hypothetical protein